uniref:Regulatory protein zeste n=1 Tax=Heliothis virescens TaxID=7102 RepID=A0A2A4JRW7_HELVI
MAEKRKRSQNFTVDEKDKLVKLMFRYKSIILNKKTDGTTNQAKNKAWVNLCTQFNATGNTYRSKDALLRVWEKLKSEAKMYNSRNRRCTTGPGGGPSSVKIDPILEQACDLLGRGCSDNSEVFDSDSVITQPIINENKSELHNEELQNLILDTELGIPIHEVKEGEDDTTIKAPICTESQAINIKNNYIEELKIKILEEELEFKRSLYNIQLEAARKELEIKTEILNQIKDGDFNFKNIFGLPKIN